MAENERKIIVITQEKLTIREAAPIADLIAMGCDRVHVRKPGARRDDLRRYLDALCPLVDTRKLSMHYFFDLAADYSFGGMHGPVLPEDFDGTRSRSCHTIGELFDNADRTDYMFISPLFDSISKSGYKAGVDIPAMKRFLKTDSDFKAVALGGISADNICEVGSMGFKGVALLGSVWKDGEKRAAGNFEKILNLWK